MVTQTLARLAGPPPVPAGTSGQGLVGTMNS